MPKLFKIGQYIVFFWSNENNEPIHIHIAVGNPVPNATKIWITQSGGCIIANNNSRIPLHDLNELLDILSMNFFYICSEWKRHFNLDSIKYYC